jgi:spore maturation protein CgeB
VKILYAAQLSPNDTVEYRAWALERLGHTVVRINSLEFQPQHPLLRKVLHRAQVGPWVQSLNQAILRTAAEQKPDVFWADKLLGLRPQTLDRLRAMGIPTVSYMIDNAFGPRRDPGWRLYRKCIPHFDLHVIQRDVNFRHYKDAGARDVVKVQTAYEPTLQFAPPQGWSDADRNREVSFVGTPYDDRAETLAWLSEQGFGVAISGNERQWLRALGPERLARLYREGELYQERYREAIWRSKINLSFLTHANQDEFVHKSFEIAGCGGFLLAERSPGHLARFREDEEAVFFTGREELAAKIRRWLPDEAGRERIAEAGCRRAARDGYHNDRQVEVILEALRAKHASLQAG